MSVTYTDSPPVSYSRPLGLQTALGADLWDKAWAEVTETFERQHSPSLWVTLETIKPVTHERGMKLVKTFWRKVCSKYRTHCYVMTFSDTQPNTRHKQKYDWHNIVCWIGASVEHEHIAKMWQAYINKIMFRTHRNDTFALDLLSVRKYAADIQDYKQRVLKHGYNHCLRYAYKHEWVDTYVACHHKGACRKRGCIHSHLESNI